jgi:hypothetical protein
MHAIAPVPSRNRTHGKSVVFDGGVPALDVAAALAPALARTVSLPQRRSQVLAAALNCSERGRGPLPGRYFRECDGAHRARPVPLLESRTRRTISIPHQEDDMASRATRFALVFGMAFATALTILAITTWARAPDSQSEWTAPIAPKQPIYRPQLRILF